MVDAVRTRVLLVEADAGKVACVQTAFQTSAVNRVEFLHTESVDSALTAIHQYSFDIIFIAVSQASGAADVMSVRAIAPASALIVLCDQDDEQFAMAMLHAGAQDCLFKSQLTPQLLLRAARYATERVRTQEQLALLTQYDGVTGLPNRVLFRDRLTQALIHAQRKGASAAVMFLDLDYFKSVNDMLGHDAGDQLLREVARRMKSQIRRGDTLARMGGDEFTVILEELNEAGAAAAVAQKIIDVMARAFVVSGEEMFINTSIGIAIYPSSGIEPAQLIKNADAALYHAKECGRGCYRFYNSDMNKLAAERLKTITQLRHALARDEFELYYQPQHDPATHAVLGFEALLRWQHPERGLVYPNEFISILEDTGLIVEVGEWALRAACRQQKLWSDAGYTGVRMAVNVSARQFHKKDFVNTVVAALRDNGVDPGALQLELTESLLVKNVGAVAATLRALHTVGVRFAIDDFGTGFSSLSYLRQFPLHSLKIDQSFLKNLDKDNDGAIVSAIILLGHSLGMKVVAEGVENEPQLMFLTSKGCDVAQGYYFSKPLVAAQALDWLAQHAYQQHTASVAALNG
ncbi:MAG: EAL domain-containing protein [Gammaproteobacteria bacterium]|nr:EAL domain-containing protein [Gammaproteobacteria bacterium]